MKKDSILKFKNAATFISAAGISDNGMTAVFRKSGNRYRYGRREYADFCKMEFDWISQTGRANISDGIQAEIEKTAQAEDGKKVNIPRVMFNMPDELNEFNSEKLPAYLEIIDQFFGQWTETLNPQNPPPEPVETLFCDQLNSMSYTQQMQQTVFLKYGVDYVKIGVDCDFCPYMYFYTDHENRGGREIWRKAFDPFIWSGVQI